MNWREKFKALDIHWATSDKGGSYHLVGKHSCLDYHALCGRPHLLDVLFKRLPSEEGDPKPEVSCVYCLLILAKMLEPYVVHARDRHRLHAMMIEMQENIRLREMAYDHRN